MKTWLMGGVLLIYTFAGYTIESTAVNIDPSVQLMEQNLCDRTQIQGCINTCNACLKTKECVSLVKESCTKLCQENIKNECHYAGE